MLDMHIHEMFLFNSSRLHFIEAFVKLRMKYQHRNIGCIQHFFGYRRAE